MIGNLRPVSDADLERLLADPAAITRFLYGSEADRTEHITLDQAWHAIHFALTGSRLGGDAPLNFLVDEGTPIGEVDVGYGPARLLTSAQVRQLAEALASIGPEELRRRIDVKELDEQAIYPGHWQRNGYTADWVVTTYADMRAFIFRAAERGQGLILYIN
jgi:hypothetical protein